MAEVEARNFAGFATYLRGDVVKVMGRVGDDAQKQRFAKTNEALAKAAVDLSAWLKKEAARGDESHVLGPVRYAKLLRVQEGLALPLADFERMNEDDLAANKKAYEELAPRAKPALVVESQLFPVARRMMDDARGLRRRPRPRHARRQRRAHSPRDAAIRAMELGVDRDERPFRDARGAPFTS